MRPRPIFVAPPVVFRLRPKERALLERAAIAGEVTLSELVRVAAVERARTIIREAEAEATMEATTS